MNIKSSPVKIAEWYNPVGYTDYISRQYVARYRFACELMEPSKSLLDIAIGSGYGSQMLIEQDLPVTSCDLDFQALAFSRQRYGMTDLINADGLIISFPDNCFDSVTMFEIIQHVHDGLGLVSEIKRVLRSGGTFICSTTNVQFSAHPPYHVHEYDPGEFLELFEWIYGHVERYCQYFTWAGRLSDLFQWNIGKTFDGFKKNRVIGYANRLARLLVDSTFRKNQIKVDEKYQVLPWEAQKLPVRIMLGVVRKI